jgi:alkylated DNA repair dioxygenase AlkB
MTVALTDFQEHRLPGGCSLLEGRLPDSLIPDTAGFELIWKLHPAEYHELKMHGRLVKTPRWQQAYGMDYHYTGNVNRALPISALLAPYHRWAVESLDESLNGLLLNWYDGSLGHYIGRHRDSQSNLVPGRPIVTISLGEERLFRLRAWPAQSGVEPMDFSARHGTVFVMPWETNLAFTHEVPASKKLTQRRISITLRAFSG